MLRRVSRGLGHELGLGLAVARPAPGSHCRDPLAVRPVTVSEPLMKARVMWDRRRLRPWRFHAVAVGRGRSGPAACRASLIN